MLSFLGYYYYDCFTVSNIVLTCLQVTNEKDTLDRAYSMSESFDLIRKRSEKINKESRKKKKYYKGYQSKVIFH